MVKQTENHLWCIVAKCWHLGGIVERVRVSDRKIDDLDSGIYPTKQCDLRHVL